MGLFGKLLSLPVKLVNVPLKVVDDLITCEDTRDKDRMLSKPLNLVSREIDKL